MRQLESQLIEVIFHPLFFRVCGHLKLVHSNKYQFHWPTAKSKVVPRRRASGLTSLIRAVSSRRVQSILNQSILKNITNFFQVICGQYFANMKRHSKNTNLFVFISIKKVNKFVSCSHLLWIVVNHQFMMHESIPPDINSRQQLLKFSLI